MVRHNYCYILAKNKHFFLLLSILTKLIDTFYRYGYTIIHGYITF